MPRAVFVLGLLPLDVHVFQQDSAPCHKAKIITNCKKNVIVLQGNFQSNFLFKLSSPKLQKRY